MTKTKETSIQIIRAIAIMQVILGHTCPEGIYQAIFRPLANFSVPLFLFLSGYLTKAHYDSWPAMFKKRTIRVFIPYLIWTAIYGLIPLDPPKEFILNFFTAKAAGHLYYIPVYIQLVLLTPLIVKLARSRYQWVGWLIMPIPTLLINYPMFYAGVTWNGNFMLVYDITFIRWFTFYYLGILLGNQIITRNFNLPRLSVAFIISIILQIGEGYLIYKMGIKHCGTQMKLTAMLTGALACMIAYTLIVNHKINIKSKLLLTIGNYSFGIYLCHVLFKRIGIELGIYQNIPYIVNTVIILALSLVLCIICDKLLGQRVCKWLGIK